MDYTVCVHDKVVYVKFEGNVNIILHSFIHF